ncbi:IclR family transcriptional regulator [Clostridium transplantifaecale]|uniref:IclR family transcriptional regulator n=1 Tax=Clostridium transplantifaecale TaxID=2479838 RepID=UPI000F63ACD4|nr:IclR family transcriptional regulator [Clostridium transplantifaecale]
MSQEYGGRTIQSVQRALDILGLFDEEHSEFSLGEISALLNLNKSTAHGLISTLYQNRYLQQKSNGKYKLGQIFLDKVVLARDNSISHLKELIKPCLDRICKHFSATSTGFFYENEKLYLAYQAVPAEGYYISVNFNDRMPLYCTASGKLLLAYQSETETRRYFTQTKLKAMTEYTIVKKSDLLKELELIREQRYSFENQEHQMGAASLAVPLFWKNSFYGTCSVTGMIYWLEKNKEEIIAELTETAKKIEGAG